MIRFSLFAFFALIVSVPASAEVASNPIRVTAIGDSITVGYAADVGNGRPTRFQDSFDAVGANVEASVVAVGGINAAGYVNQGFLDQALATAPDIVVVNLGANDSSRWVSDPNSIGWYKEHYNEILDGLFSLEKPPEVIISTVLPFAPYDPVADPVRHLTAQAVVNEINPWLIQRADETGAVLADQYTRWLNKPFFENAFSDAVHPRPIFRDELAADYRDEVLAVASTIAVPEPNAVLLLSALSCLGMLRRRR